MRVILLFTSLLFLLSSVETYGQACGSKTVAASYYGNLASVTSYEGVSTPGKALGHPDYNLFNLTQAEFSEGDYAVYDLQRFVPGGKKVEIHLIISLGDRMKVSSSRNNLSFSEAKTFYNDLALISTLLSFDYVVPAGGARYLRFESAAGHISLDAVVYDFTTCLPDADSDGIADESDRDDDNDGLDDLGESSYMTDPSADEDLDGTPNYADFDTPGFADSNGDNVDDMADMDLDGIPNHLDLDSDNDALPDAFEANGGTLPVNFTSEGRYTASYMAGDDSNGDGLADSATGMLTDTDTDGIYDHLDLDSDDDGITDVREAGESDQDGDGHLDAFADADGDGLTDAYDPDFSGNLILVSQTDGDGTPDYIDSDSDADGVPDIVEAHDRNMDGVADWDGNKNRLPDVEEGATDTNLNGLKDIFDPHAGAAAVALQDTDEDGVPDYRDLDDDNDGLSTRVEDVNGNGIFSDDFTAGQFGDFLGTPDYLYNNFLVLPVTLISFVAETVLNTINLTWITANEENNSHFEIERADGSFVFETVGTVPGIGISGQEQLYTFTDLLPLHGTSYYRLKQVDDSGYFTYSDVVRAEVSLLPLADILMTVYPNPLGPNEDLTIDLSNLDPTKPVTIVITDLFGKIVFQETYDPASGRKTPILRSRLPGRDGMYMVQASNGDQTITERLYLSFLF